MIYDIIERAVEMEPCIREGKMSQISAYEKKAMQPIRVSCIEMDFINHIYPKWYPIAQNTRLCCHYHLHEHIEIIVVDEGCISFFVNGVQHDLAKDDVLFINPFEPHSAFVSNRCDRALYYAVNLDPNFLNCERIQICQSQSLYDRVVRL